MTITATELGTIALVCAGIAIILGRRGFGGKLALVGVVLISAATLLSR